MKTPFELSLDFERGYIILTSTGEGVKIAMGGNEMQKNEGCIISPQELLDLHELINFIIEGSKC